MRFLNSIFLFTCINSFSQTQPPKAEMRPVIDDYFGLKIVDSFRYMEDGKLKEVQDWFKAQTDYSTEVLNQIPNRDKFIENFKKNENKKGPNIERLAITNNDFYFYTKNEVNDKTGKLYVKNGFKGKEKMLFDPSVFQPEKKVNYQITSVTPSLDGKKVAFGLSYSGKEVSNIYVIDLVTNKLIDDHVERVTVKAPSWLPDGNSFLCIKVSTDNHNSPNFLLDSKTYIHKLRTEGKDDIEFFSKTTNPELNFASHDFPIVSYDENSKLLFAVKGGTKFLNMYMAPISEIGKEKIAWTNMYDYKKDKADKVVASGSDIYYRTAFNSPNFKITKSSISNPGFENSVDFIKETDEVISNFVVTKDGFYYSTFKNGLEAFLYFVGNNNETPIKIELPKKAGALEILSRNSNSSDLWVTISGWTFSKERFRYDLKKNKFVLESLIPVIEYTEFKDIVVEERLAPSYDGLMIPITIMYKKNIQKDANNSV
jgi:prolyl oligopeptidase